LEVKALGYSTALKRSGSMDHNSLWYRIKTNKAAYFFIAPWFLLFLAFTVYPVIFSGYLGFTSYNPLKPSTINDFVGFQNYRNLFSDRDFLVSLRNTLVFTFGTIPFTTVFALLLALALNKGVKFKTLFRVGFFLPTVTSLAVISTLFVLLCNQYGLISQIVQFFGGKPTNWLNNQHTALLSIMGMSVWAATGYYMLLYLSTLQSIPQELYEAATVDGANGIQKFFNVTLPHLRHITLYIIILNTINSLQVFTEPQIMTGGGPGYATTTVVLYLYKRAFSSQMMGYASAVGYTLFILILIFALIQLKVLGFDRRIDE